MKHLIRSIVLACIALMPAQLVWALDCQLPCYQNGNDEYCTCSPGNTLQNATCVSSLVADEVIKYLSCETGDSSNDVKYQCLNGWNEQTDSNNDEGVWLCSSNTTIP